MFCCTAACATIAGRSVVRPVRPLVSFALFAGGSMVVAAATLALSAQNRKLDATGPII